MTASDQKIEAEIEHHQELLKVHKRNLNALQVREAKYGLDVPVKIMNEISDLREKILQTESEIVRLQTINMDSQMNSENTNLTNFEGDSQLQFWIRMAEKHQFRTAVTLNVQGVFISGIIVGYADYIDDMANFIEKRSRVIGNDKGEEIINALVVGFRQGLDRIASEKNEKEESGEPNNQEDDNPHYVIHLRDARAWHPQFPLHPTEGAPWRIRVLTVSGFMLGSPFPDLGISYS